MPNVEAVDAPSAPDPEVGGFPRRYTALFALIAMGLVVGGFALWWPERDDGSTAQSDLGLTLLGGGVAGAVGYLVSRAVFVAQSRVDRAVRQSEARRERDNQRIMLSMTERMRGVDLRDADLGDVTLRDKDLRGANLRRANLEGATIDRVSLREASLAGANLRRAKLGAPGALVDMIDADLTQADLREAIVLADLRAAKLRRAKLQGADLTGATIGHPRPDQADPQALDRQAADFRGAEYDERTEWPEGFDRDAAGAKYAPEWADAIEPAS